MITYCVCVIDYLRLLHLKKNIIAPRPVLCFVFDVYIRMLLCDFQSFIKESYYYYYIVAITTTTSITIIIVLTTIYRINPD